MTTDTQNSHQGNKVSPLHEPHCHTCSLNSLCLPIALEDNDIKRLDELINRGRPIQKGQILFHQGDTFNGIFAIRSGAVKIYTVSDDGEEQINGFHLASELVGLAGYDLGEFPMSAKALETTTVCEIPLDKVEMLADEIPNFRKQLMRTMADSIRKDHTLMMLLSKKNADERIAAFLLDISHRYARRGFSAKVFRLPMSRVDMANHLGLAVETVSRVFSRFQKQEIVTTEGRDVTISSIDDLSKLAGQSSDSDVIQKA